MKRRSMALIAYLTGLALAVPGLARAQGFGTSTPRPRPWSRVSFFTNSASFVTDGQPTLNLTEISTAFSYQLPDLDDNGADYGADLRFSSASSQSRPDRVSIYESFVGLRLAQGRLRARAGHLLLTDLGTLGSLAGGLVELRQTRREPDQSRFRAGVFGGLEPNVLEAGYADHVRKFGAYAAFENGSGRRHSFGYALVRNGSLTEHSSLVTTNFFSYRRSLYVYQSAEYNLVQPLGMAERGLAYFFGSVRIQAHERLELQATYNRGRSIDVRGLGDDVLNGRPVTQSAVDGLLFESIGSRVTIEVVPHVRLYGGYSRDRNNRDADPTGRTLIGGYASNLAGTGLDLAASDSLMERPTGSYHSQYVSVGRQLGRRVYASGDYSTSLSVIRFSRSDGIVIETRPQTRRLSATATVNVGRGVSLLTTAERTDEDFGHDVRILSGITYRIR